MIGSAVALAVSVAACTIVLTLVYRRRRPKPSPPPYTNTQTAATVVDLEVPSSPEELQKQLRQTRQQLEKAQEAARKAALAGCARLFHQTDSETAEIILRTQEMKPGTSGLAGGGIYFATSKELTHHKATRKGVILEATVRLGKIKTLDADGDRGMTHSKLQRMGFDSVCLARQVSSGHEYVVYDSKQVFYIERVGQGR